MELVQQTLEHTPIWVLVTFVFFIGYGVKASNDRVVSFWELLILGILLPVFSVHTVLVAFPPAPVVAVAWIFSVLAGLVVGSVVLSTVSVSVDQENKLILMPGTWRPLLLLVLLFACRFFVAFTLASDPNLLRQTFDKLIALGLSGSCGGFFLGQLAISFTKLRKGPHVVLKLSES